GSDLATTSAPRFCAAPGRFSIMTGTPHLDESFSPMIRGTTSSSGPGGVGTTILIARSGYPSAVAGLVVAPVRQIAVKRQATSDERISRFMDWFLRLTETPVWSVLVGTVSIGARAVSWGQCPDRPPKMNACCPENRDRRREIIFGSNPTKP